MEKYYDIILWIILLCLVFASIPIMIPVGKRYWWRKIANRKWWKEYGIWKVYKAAGIMALVLSIVLLISLFIDDSGGFIWWHIDSARWYEFFGVVGAFFLVITLLFQVRSFRKQQVEAKFFEMVRYYRDNISEMRFRNPFYYEDIENKREVDEQYVSGRRVIKIIFEQYKAARKICHFKIENDTKCKCPIDQISKMEKKYNQKGFNKIPGKNGDRKVFKSNEWKKKFVLNEIAYQIVFWGIPQRADIELKRYTDYLFNDKSIEKINDEDQKDLYELIKSIVTVWEYSGDKKEYSDYLRIENKEIKKDDDIVESNNADEKVKFFGGHQYHLGHFFRHLYESVKYIDGQPSWLMTNKEKYDYIKTLRAQMSNYEQALLLISSLTKLGRNWEYDNEEKNLISDYNLIKNLPQNFIPYMEPQYFYPDVDYEWEM